VFYLLSHLNYYLWLIDLCYLLKILHYSNFIRLILKLIGMIKKKDWEGIILLPFINVNLLVSETSKLSDRLCEQEKKRNSFGSTYHFQCHSNSLLQLISPQISYYHLPPLPPNSHPFRLLPEALLTQKTSSDIPYLQSIFIESSIPLHIHVDVFGSRSQKASLVVSLADDYDARKREDIANAFLGKICSLWPYKREVLVIGFSDMECEQFQDKPPKKYSPKETEQWNTKAETLQRKYKETRALNFIVSCIFTVRFSRKPGDPSTREWNSKPELIPFQFLTLSK